MITGVKIEGMKEVEQLLKKMPDKMKKAELKKLLRASTADTIDAARSHVPQSSRPHHRYSGGKKVATYTPGNLRKSIGNITGRNRTNPTIYVGPRAGKNRKYDGYYGNFVEYGTVNAPAQPFMRPAYEQTKGQAGPAAAKKIARYVQKVIDKNSKA